MISGSQGSGTRFLTLLRAEASKTKPQDRALVKSQFDSFVNKGHAGPLDLQFFNEHYRKFNKLLRVLPSAQRMSEEDTCEMINKLMFMDPNVATVFELKLEVNPPSGDICSSSDKDPAARPRPAAFSRGALRALRARRRAQPTVACLAQARFR